MNLTESVTKIVKFSIVEKLYSYFQFLLSPKIRLFSVSRARSLLFGCNLRYLLYKDFLHAGLNIPYHIETSPLICRAINY